MSEALDAWDSSLSRLVEEEIARKVADIRAYLIAEISRAMFDSEALLATDSDGLAEIAVDVMIEFAHKIRSGGVG
jgi:hypothetical protein